MWERIKQVQPATWARTACLLLAFINQMLAILGKEALPILEDDVYQLVSLFFTLAIGGWNWWENNSFTTAAIEADKKYDELKAAEKAAKG